MNIAVKAYTFSPWLLQSFKALNPKSLAQEQSTWTWEGGLFRGATQRDLRVVVYGVKPKIGKSPKNPIPLIKEYTLYHRNKASIV